MDTSCIGSSERLFYRDLHESDSEFILSLITSPEWLSGIGPRGNDGKEYIAQNGAKENRLFAAVEKGTNRLVGLVGLLQRDYLEFRDIGYALDASFVGRGFASESVRWFLANRLKEDEKKIGATVKPTNKKSRSLLERNGFKHIGECVGGVELYVWEKKEV